MAHRDVSGKLHRGMFEEIELPDVDATLRPTSGRGHCKYYGATGPDAIPSAEPQKIRSVHARMMQTEAMHKGLVKPPAPTGEALYPVY